MSTADLPSVLPKAGWRFGRCFCCERPNVVAPGPVFDGWSLPFCPGCLERVVRWRRRALMRADLVNNNSTDTVG